MRKYGRHFVRTMAFGLLMASVLVHEGMFSLRAKSAMAVVVDHTYAGGRSGSTFTDVRYNNNGRLLVATLRGCLLHLEPGEQIPIVYLANDPKNVILDQFFQRNFASLLALAAFAIAAIVDVESFKAWQRRQEVPWLRG